MAYIRLSYRRMLAPYPPHKQRRRAREIDAFLAALQTRCTRMFDDCAQMQPAGERGIGGGANSHHDESVPPSVGGAQTAERGAPKSGNAAATAQTGGAA